MPDRYANGNKANDTGGLSGPRGKTGFDPTDTGYYHGGDLQGLTANLKRIHDLGFTALWVTPVLKQQTVSQGTAAYHGYWGLDFTTVDPHLGTDQDFADLTAGGARARDEGVPRRRREPHRGRRPARPARRTATFRSATATARSSTRPATSPPRRSRA